MTCKAIKVLYVELELNPKFLISLSQRWSLFVLMLLLFLFCIYQKILPSVFVLFCTDILSICILYPIWRSIVGCPQCEIFSDSNFFLLTKLIPQNFYSVNSATSYIKVIFNLYSFCRSMLLSLRHDVFLISFIQAKFWEKNNL